MKYGKNEPRGFSSWLPVDGEGKRVIFLSIDFYY